jgi:hypothetical protein
MNKFTFKCHEFFHFNNCIPYIGTTSYVKVYLAHFARLSAFPYKISRLNDSDNTCHMAGIVSSQFTIAFPMFFHVSKSPKATIPSTASPIPCPVPSTKPSQICSSNDFSSGFSKTKITKTPPTTRGGSLLYQSSSSSYSRKLERNSSNDAAT